MTDDNAGHGPSIDAWLSARFGDRTPTKDEIRTALRAEREAKAHSGNDDFAQRVASLQAEADATSAADPRDNATVLSETAEALGPEHGPAFVRWVQHMIGGRAPTRAELWVLFDAFTAAAGTTEDEDEALDRILADLDLGHAAEARQQLRAEWSAIDSDFTTAEFFDELVRRGALSAEQARRELAFIETWTAARERAQAPAEDRAEGDHHA